MPLFLVLFELSCGLASVDMPLLVVEFQARGYKMICLAQMNIEHVIPFEKQL